MPSGTLDFTNREPSRAVVNRWKRDGTTYETVVGYIHRHIVVSETGCWEWQGHRNHHGYAIGNHRSLPDRLAHRLVWRVMRGPVPDGLELDHLCRVRHCVNPDHLEAVTPKTNSERSPHFHKTHCIRGHEFTPENTILRRRGRACRECYRTVYDVRRGRRAA